jgi:hypothetical protein
MDSPQRKAGASCQSSTAMCWSHKHCCPMQDASRSVCKPEFESPLLSRSVLVTAWNCRCSHWGSAERDTPTQGGPLRTGEKSSCSLMCGSCSLNPGPLWVLRFESGTSAFLISFFSILPVVRRQWSSKALKNLKIWLIQMLCDERVISSCEEGTAGREVKAEKSWRRTFTCCLSTKWMLQRHNHDC